MAKYLDKSKEKWEELVDQWHSDPSLTCSLQEYLELDDIEYLKFAHGIDDPDISDTEVLEKSAGITRDAVTELVIKPALKKAIQVSNTFNLDLSKVKIRDDKIVIKDGEKLQTSQTFGITLVEKPNVDGLTKAEVMEMYDQMDGDEAYPLEIGGSETSAMGFITPEAAEILDYDYEDSGLNDFVSVILNDMNNESEDGTYEFRGIRIHLSR